MATLTINIPDAIAARVVNGVCKRYHYSTTLEDGTPNPETKQQFFKRMVIVFLKRAVREAEVETTSQEAAEAAAASVETDITLS
jgi:hypothetical protein